jgi:hypothetical protein
MIPLGKGGLWVKNKSTVDLRKERGMEWESNWNAQYVNEAIKKEREMDREQVATQKEIMRVYDELIRAQDEKMGKQIVESKREQEERRKRLYDTQNMRVVALNESVKIALASIQHEMENVTAENIVNIANTFAKFLIDGE